MQNKIGKLFIISTPIGNLADITLRALDTLKKVDAILCEDTRVTSRLLSKYSIDKPLLVYNDHSKQDLRQKILDRILEGQNLALVSDAGTPLIADPGYKLIEMLRKENVTIHPIPGACSAIAALTISAIPSDRFMFVGFLPHKVKAKETLFAELKLIKTSLICFEAPNRLLSSLELMDIFFCDRKIVVAREITKLYEEAKDGTALELYKYYQENLDKLKGEIVILISPPTDEVNSDEEILEQLSLLMKDSSLRDSVEIIAQQVSLPKKQIYKMALQLQK